MNCMLACRPQGCERRVADNSFCVQVQRWRCVYNAVIPLNISFLSARRTAKIEHTTTASVPSLLLRNLLPSNFIFRLPAYALLIPSDDIISISPLQSSPTARNRPPSIPFPLLFATPDPNPPAPGLHNSPFTIPVSSLEPSHPQKPHGSPPPPSHARHPRMHACTHAPFDPGNAEPRPQLR